YVLVFEPAMLLDGPILDLLPALVTVIIGMVSLAAGFGGFFLTNANTVERVVLIVSGILLVIPQLLVSGLRAIGPAIVLSMHYAKSAGERTQAKAEEPHTVGPRVERTPSSLFS